jgi:HK97 family phage major capsid protein
MNDELKNTLGEIKGALDTKLDEIKDSQKSLNDRLSAVEMASSRVQPISGLKDYTAEKFSFARAIRAIATKDWSEAGFEKAVFNEVSKTVQNAGSDPYGGYIVPNEYVADIIELLRHQIVVATLGATMLENLTTSPIEWPKQLTATTAYWVGENEAITDSDITFGQISMTPKSCAAMVKLSNRILRMSNPSIEALIRSDIATQLALAIDLACIRGTGVQNQPLGLVNQEGINTLALGENGAVPDFDDLMEMAYEVEIDHALTGNLSYMFHPAIRKVLQQIRVPDYSATQGPYMVSPPVSEAALGTMIGYPFKVNTQIPTDLAKGTASNCSEIYFGNWSQMLIAHWGGIQIMASEHTSTAFATNQTWIRIIQDIDVGVRQPTAFCVCSDAKIA